VAQSLEAISGVIRGSKCIVLTLARGISPDLLVVGGNSDGYLTAYALRILTDLHILVKSITAADHFASIVFAHER
jgi:hypothetical protein